MGEALLRAVDTCGVNAVLDFKTLPESIHSELAIKKSKYVGNGQSDSRNVTINLICTSHTLSYRTPQGEDTLYEMQYSC